MSQFNVDGLRVTLFCCLGGSDSKDVILDLICVQHELVIFCALSLSVVCAVSLWYHHPFIAADLAG